MSFRKEAELKKSIIVAAVAMSIIISFSIYSSIISQDFSPGSFLRLSIQFLLLFGLIKGNRLVWQWGRLLTILAFVGILLATIMIVSKGGSFAHAIPFLFYGVPALIIFISFGTHSAKEHFRLVCPNCANVKAKSNDFILTMSNVKSVIMCGTNSLVVANKPLHSRPGYSYAYSKCFRKSKYITFSKSVAVHLPGG
jgi:hypothetical protein